MAQLVEEATTANPIVHDYTYHSTKKHAANRFSYVENNPINFNDWTGYCKNGRATRSGSCTTPTTNLVTFDITDGCTTCSWSDAEKQTIQTAPMDTDIVDDRGVNRLIDDVHWAVHKLGHSFVNAISGKWITLEI